jgi:hypothetical protein
MIEVAALADSQPLVPAGVQSSTCRGQRCQRRLPFLATRHVTDDAALTELTEIGY